MVPVVSAAPESPTAAVSRDAGRGWSLQIIGEGFVQRHALPERGHVVLGRSAAVDIQIDDASISRRHAILHVGATFELEDLGSVNGTLVRDRVLEQGRLTPVSPHELLRLGTVLAIVQPGGAERASHAPQQTTRARVPSSAPLPVAPSSIPSPAMQSCHQLLVRIAPSDLAVLITGETGVGKEVAAQLLHRLSPRAARPIVGINCAALAETLLESELFGHERGAFTGAAGAKAGLLESAEGGTVFLDEIGELTLALQAKLLRAVETREVTRLGGLRPRTLDVRFVAATNRHLPTEVSAGRFRQDLYFRLDGITVTIPPLRERREEIEALALTFVAAAASRGKRAIVPTLAPGALARLETHPWPGNIRQLRNLMERAVLLCETNTIDEACLDPLLRDAGAPPTATRPDGPLLSPTAQAERELIVEALRLCDGNQTKTARHLGISRATLLMRLDAYRLARPRKRSPFAG